MSSTHGRALTRLLAAPLFLAAIAGCTFHPGEGPGGGGTPTDGGTPPPPTDGGTPPPPPTDGGTPPPPTDGGAVTPVDAQVPPGPDAGSPQRRKQITILPDKVEAPGDGDLIDFPVLFSVVDPDLAARASTDGSDIYFTAQDGTTRLTHDIETWDPATGALIAWVKVPKVQATRNTNFYIYYGDPAAAGTADPTAVWSNGFAAVWHLAETPVSATGAIRDATSGNDGTTHSSMGASDQVSGQIGNAIDFDGSNDEIQFTNPIAGTTPHTISAWVNQRTTTSNDSLVTLGNGQTNRARWFHTVYTNNEVAVGFYGNDWETGVNIIGDGWTLLHWVYDGSDNWLYVDGVLAAGPDPVASGVDTQGVAGRIGNVTSSAFGGNMNLNGQADEVRIATDVRPAEWIQTEFNNQSAPSTFYRIGVEEAL